MTKKVRRWKIEVELWDELDEGYIPYKKRQINEAIRDGIECLEGGYKLPESKFKNLKIRRIK